MRSCPSCQRDIPTLSFHPRAVRCRACVAEGRCRDCGRTAPAVEFAEKSARCRECASRYAASWKRAHPGYEQAYYADWKVRRLVGRLWSGCRRRSIKHEVPFTLVEADLVVPTHCPVLGIPMSVGTLQDKDASPTVDRMIPALGYVPGNIAVISHRANRIKSDATIAELEKIVAWIRATL